MLYSCIISLPVLEFTARYDIPPFDYGTHSTVYTLVLFFFFLVFFPIASFVVFVTVEIILSSE